MTAYMLSDTRTLRHSTEQTGDVQTFAVCRENYDPAVIAATVRMEHEPIIGYRLKVLGRESCDLHGCCAVRFLVCREDGTPLTDNQCSRQGHLLSLHTSVLYPMPPDEAIMMADLEQCAALGLLGEDI